MHTFAFERLSVWQDAKRLVVKIYQLTREFPSDERFGLTNQMRSASVSVCSNIAEGSGRKTVKDQAQFYSISYTSLLELLNHLLISVDLGFISLEKMFEVRSDVEIVSLKITSLRKSILNPKP